MILYGLTTCDTCRRARKALPDAEFVDVRADGVPPDVLSEALGIFGEKLVNTRSTTWRMLDETQRKRPPLAVLQDHPTLMKRPLIKVGGTYYLGWTATVQAALAGV